jgi:hypothetical protein
MDTPESIKSHEPDYRPNAWQEYTIEELGWWVRLLTKRSTHRADRVKREKDLGEAQVYADMLKAKKEAEGWAD